MTLGGLADTVANQTSIGFESLGQKLLALLRFLRPADGWLSVFLLALNLIVVVWSVERADWAPTPSLVQLILLALLTGLVLSRVPLWAILVLPVGMAIGLFVIIWQLTSFQAEGLQFANAGELGQRLNLWLEAAKAGSINIDRAPFAFGLMVITWLAGYLAAWVFFRYGNFWGVFILGGAGLMSNLTYLPASANTDLLFYLLTALLLIGRVQSVRRRREWQRRNFQYDGHLGLLAITDSVFIAISVLLVAYLLPVGRPWGPTHAVYEYSRSPLARWEDDFNRLFAGLPARRPLPYRIWGDVIAFQGTINPTTTPVLQVNSPVPMYWKARTYGTYTPKGWVSADTILKPTDWTPSYAVAQPYRKRFEVTHAVTPNYDTRSLFAGGQILAADRDVRIETYDSPVYILSLSDPKAFTDLPQPLAQAALSLNRTIQRTAGTASDSALAQELPPGFELNQVSRDGGAIQSVTLTEVIPEQPDTLSLRAVRGNAKAGDTYQITSSVSLAEPEDLRRAGVNYPTWVMVKYTQLPAELPQRVRDLASQLTAGADTPYDKAMAIENYLKTLNYSLEVEPPPYNADGVDHFLFTLREGYSEYFGSAMTVMLRSEGIPARLATGYTVGDKLPNHDVYIVTDSHSHAWVEVFFPTYGWIALEPTPGSSIPLAFIPAPDPEALIANLAGVPGLDLLCDEEDDDDCEDGIDRSQSAGDGSTEGLVPWTTRLAQALPWIIALLVVAIAGGSLGWLFWRRFLTPSTDPQVTFRQLAFLGGLSAMGPANHQTPYQYRRRLDEAFPAQRDHLSVIVSTYVRSLYGRKELSERERQGLVSAWLGVRLPMLAHILRRRNK